jgi:hypothetical protein
MDLATDSADVTGTFGFFLCDAGFLGFFAFGSSVNGPIQQ